jgi:hypothetical protein
MAVHGHIVVVRCVQLLYYILVRRKLWIRIIIGWLLFKESSQNYVGVLMTDHEVASVFLLPLICVLIESPLEIVWVARARVLFIGEDLVNEILTF